MLAKSQAYCDGTPFSLLSRNLPLSRSLYIKARIYLAVSMKSVLLANPAMMHVSLMPLNVVLLGAPFNAEMDAVRLVSAPYTFSDDTSLKTAFR
jgi:hypothetical protein